MFSNPRKGASFNIGIVPERAGITGMILAGGSSTFPGQVLGGGHRFDSDIPEKFKRIDVNGHKPTFSLEGELWSARATSNREFKTDGGLCFRDAERIENHW